MKSYCTMCRTYTPNGIAGELHTESCPALKARTATDDVTNCAFCQRIEGHDARCPAVTGTRAFTEAMADMECPECRATDGHLHAPFCPRVIRPQEKPSNPKDALGVNKAPMSTVSAVVLAEVGVAMLEGAAKYGRHNYRAVGVRSSVYYDAAMRHLMAWWEGQDIDPDSEMSHITKAITSLIVLRDAMLYEKLVDDRPPACPEFYTRLNKKTAEINLIHHDKNPKRYTRDDITYGMDRASSGSGATGCAADPADPRPGL